MRRTLAAPSLLDVSLAAVLLVVKLVTLATGVQAGSGWVSYLAAPLWTLPLAWRRRYPLAVTVVVMATSVAEAGVGGFHNSVVGLFVLVLLPYSVGAHSVSGRRMLAGLAVVLAAGGWVALDPAGQPASSLLGDAAVVLLPSFAGLAVRQQRLRAQALGQLAERRERERDERARVAVAEERTRIARELHDELAHAMSVIAVQADAAEGALERDPSLVARPLVAIRETARGALADMRRVLGGLRGDGELAELSPDPGLARLGALLDQARVAGLDVDLRVEGEPTPLPPALDLAAYRVLQEGLTNVRKHAAARHVDVVLRYRTDVIDVEITDDGDGSGAGGGTGQGLAGLRERVGLLGGEFVAGPRTRGFALRVSLPLA